MFYIGTNRGTTLVKKIIMRAHLQSTYVTHKMSKLSNFGTTLVKKIIMNAHLQSTYVTNKMSKLSNFGVYIW